MTRYYVNFSSFLGRRLPDFYLLLDTEKPLYLHFTEIGTNSQLRKVGK